MLDELSLLPLLKAPKKKYIRKLIEFTIGIPSLSAVPQHYTTPIFEQSSIDLGLEPPQLHALICSLFQVVDNCLSCNFNEQRMGSLFSSEFDESLKSVLIELVVALRTGTHQLNIEIEWARVGSVGQGSQLLETDWQLDIEMANQKEKSNCPVVTMQLKTGKDGALQATRLEMNAQQFKAFFSKLQNIKNHLIQLIQ